jgi:hypothetical protein
MSEEHTTSSTRREFLAGALGASAAAAQTSAPQQLLEVDHRRLVSRADLRYDKPVTRSEEGLPVGNGRMGTLVWTTPTQLRMQINRVDVYANNSYSNSFFERHNDYCGGCAYVDVNLGATTDPFPETGFSQHLSVYDGLLTIKGNGVTARIVAWPEQDVIAIAVEDTRRAGDRVDVTLRMLRFASQYFGNRLEEFIRNRIVAVQNRSHTAASQLRIENGRIILTQDFREGDYSCKSAVAAGVIGVQHRAQFVNETDVRVTAAPNADSLLILIASAATFDAKEDPAASALRQLEAAAAKGYDVLARETADWWHRFWSRGFVHLTSADGTADYVEQHYTWFLYVMGASSRGKYPPKFNGMIWNTGGDLRTWGTQHWFANLSCYYEAIPASNRMELLDPALDMYSAMFEACSVAARQQWGSQGMYIPETVYFDGLEKLPDDIAAEMRELYLMRKPWEQRSARFIEYASTKHPHSSRWNWNLSGGWVNGRWVTKERGSGPYGAVNHIFGTTAKVAWLYWRRYEFTLDREWLRARAYPMLKAAAEFYRNYPNVRKGDDGKYHIHGVNSNESVWGARDTDEDLSAMRAIFAALLRASDLLGADADMRPKWREFLDNLAPVPTSDHPDALLPEGGYKGPRVFVRGLKPAVKPAGLLPDGNSLPMWYFDLCHPETRDRQFLETANATLNGYFREGLRPDTPVSVLSKVAIAAAALGRGDAVRVLIPNQIRVLTRERGTAYQGGGVLRNRMTLREGPQAIDVQRLGRASEALQLALLHSYSPAPGEEPVLRVFPAWPKEWNASFRLLARGAFLVSSSIAAGSIGPVELESKAGAECRLRNPWGEAAVMLHRDGRPSETLKGGLLRFSTRAGERIVIAPAATKPAQKRVI